MVTRKSNISKDTIVSVSMIVPALILVVVFTIMPFFMSLVLSLTDGPGNNIESFVGLNHFIRVFNDKKFLSIDASSGIPKGALINTLLWMITAVPGTIALGFLIALAANNKEGEGLFRSAFFLPMVLAGTVLGIIWAFVYSPNKGIGLLNAILDKNISWLGDSNIVNFSLIFAWIWAQTGMAVVISAAALKGVPIDQIEASKIDGANRVTRLFKIILPEIHPQMYMLITTLLVSVLKVFDIVKVMTNGGPANQSITLALLFYEQTFSFYKPHYGAAIVVVMSVIVFGVYGINNWIQKRGVEDR